MVTLSSDDCDDCTHPLSHHDEYGHCEDECPCRRCDWKTCESDLCQTRRQAKSEWDAAKTHDPATCPCAVCKWKRRNA